jgi:hypothetical protein
MNVYIDFLGYNDFGQYVVVDAKTRKWQFTYPMKELEGFKKKIKERNYQVVNNPRFSDSAGHQELVKEFNT